MQSEYPPDIARAWYSPFDPKPPVLESSGVFCRHAYCAQILSSYLLGGNLQVLYQYLDLDYLKVGEVGARFEHIEAVFIYLLLVMKPIWLDCDPVNPSGACIRGRADTGSVIGT